MLSLAVTFPAGRYHATPWDRHVNEGSVSWPPEPVRLLRALIATWHHKVKHTGRHNEVVLHALVEALAHELPHYRLPAASHSHSRHYMPQRQAADTSLVFDAFAAVSRDEPLHVVWPNLDLMRPQIELLDDLLAVIGYLGRAESWVDVSRVAAAPTMLNCVPGDQAVDLETGEVRGEVVSLFAAIPAVEYYALRERFVPNKAAEKELGPTLPETLLDALSVNTSALRKQGWSQHPATRKVAYLRPIDALRPNRVARRGEPPTFTTARYLLLAYRHGRDGRPSTTPLPGVEDTVRVGELLRAAVMSRAGERTSIAATLSGHGLPAGNRHEHAFYLPFDSNGDGRIDRLLVHVPLSIGTTERKVLEKLDRIWSRGEGEWRVILESFGGKRVGEPLTASGASWESVTWS